MNRIRRWLLRRVLEGILSLKCPERFVTSGEEGAGLNCFIAKARSADDEDYVLLGILEETVHGLKYDGTRYAIPMAVTIDEICRGGLQVTHYYGYDRVIYDGIFAVALGRLTRWPYLLIHLRRLWNAIAQWAFNRRSKLTRNRLATLRDVVEIVESIGEAAVDSMDILTHRYGTRWAHHPNWEAQQRLLDFHLDALCESGELEKLGHRYRPRGQALKTLWQSEEEDRRHNANFRLQFLIFLVAALGLAMAAGQSGLIRLPTILDLQSNQEGRAALSTDCANPVPRL